MSRPEIPIDWEQVDTMIKHGSPGTEIANYLGMHAESFYHRVEQKYGVCFTVYASKKKSSGEYLIREAQFKKAVNKLDNTMLIWLGKQRLGQRENPSETHISEELMKPFLALMSQLSSFQADRKIEDNSIISEPKSE